MFIQFYPNCNEYYENYQHLTNATEYPQTITGLNRFLSDKAAESFTYVKGYSGRSVKRDDYSDTITINGITAGSIISCSISVWRSSGWGSATYGELQMSLNNETWEKVPFNNNIYYIVQDYDVLYLRVHAHGGISVNSSNASDQCQTQVTMKNFYIEWNV